MRLRQNFHFQEIHRRKRREEKSFTAEDAESAEKSMFARTRANIYSPIFIDIASVQNNVRL